MAFMTYWAVVTGAGTLLVNLDNVSMQTMYNASLIIVKEVHGLFVYKDRWFTHGSEHLTVDDAAALVSRHMEMHECVSRRRSW
jgi:hypothetical protein